MLLHYKWWQPVGNATVVALQMTTTQQLYYNWRQQVDNAAVILQLPATSWQRRNTGVVALQLMTTSQQHNIIYYNASVVVVTEMYRKQSCKQWTTGLSYTHFLWLISIQFHSGYVVLLYGAEEPTGNDSIFRTFTFRCVNVCYPH